MAGILAKGNIISLQIIGGQEADRKVTSRVKTGILFTMVSALLLTTAPAVFAQQDGRGRITGLPLPRYISLKSKTANVRRGPSTSNRIDWVYAHRGMPLLVLAEYQEWFRVQDADGEGGWVSTGLLSSIRTVLVQEDKLIMREAPRRSSAPIAELEAGVIARMGECVPEWCEATVDGYNGWLRKDAIWGEDPE